MKRRIFEIISPAKDGDKFSSIFDLLVIVIIALNVISITLSTFSVTDNDINFFHDAVEIVSVTVFTIEYLLRLWTSDLLYPERGKIVSRLRYMVSIMAIIDLLSIVPFYLPLFVAIDPMLLRSLRIIRLLRVFKLHRYTMALSSMQMVLKRKAKQLTSSVSVIIVLIMIASIMIYDIEAAAQPEVFENAFSGFWWSVATITTVGYGDIVPITLAGKVFSSIVAFLGIGLIAVPTGIISAGFVELDNERHEKKLAQEMLKAKKEQEKKCFCPYCGKRVD